MYGVSFGWGHTHSMWKFLGQASNLLHSSHPSCFSDKLQNYNTVTQQFHVTSLIPLGAIY